MQIGLIGLGKMGGNMRERLRLAGHEGIGYDRNQAISDAKNLKDLVAKLDAPRLVALRAGQDRQSHRRAPVRP